MLIILCKVSSRPAHVSIKIEVRENSSAAKEDKLEYMKCYWKGPKLYRFSRYATQNFLRRPTMVAVIFKDFKPPSKKIPSYAPVSYQSDPFWYTF